MKANCFFSERCVNPSGCNLSVADAANCSFIAEIGAVKQRVIKIILNVLRKCGRYFFSEPWYRRLKAAALKAKLTETEFGEAEAAAADQFSIESNAKAEAEKNFCTIFGDGKCSFSSICSKKILEASGCALLKFVSQQNGFCESLLKCNKNGIKCTPEIVAVSGCAVAKQELSKKPVAEIISHELKENGFYCMEGPWYETLKKSFLVLKDFNVAESTALKNFTMSKLFGINPNGGRRAVRTPLER